MTECVKMKRRIILIQKGHSENNYGSIETIQIECLAERKRNKC